MWWSMSVIPLLGVAEAGEVGVRGYPGLYTETHVGLGEQSEVRKVSLDGGSHLGLSIAWE